METVCPPLLHIVQVTSSSLIVGGAMSLNTLIDILQTNVDKSVTFSHLSDHLSQIANVPVRNVS